MFLVVHKGRLSFSLLPEGAWSLFHAVRVDLCNAVMNAFINEH